MSDQGQSDAKYPRDVKNIYFPACNLTLFWLSTNSWLHTARSPLTLVSLTFARLSACSHTCHWTRLPIPMSHVNKSNGAYLSCLCLLITWRPTFAPIVTCYVTESLSDHICALISIGFRLPYLLCYLTSLHFTNLPWIFPIFLASVPFVSHPI